MKRNFKKPQKILLERFEEKIFYSPDGCWYWTGAINSSGYGHMTLRPTTIYAHRISYSLYKGVIKDELYVLHKCDNKLCVNPDHLFLGTHDDNMKYMVTKGRSNNIFTIPNHPKSHEFLGRKKTYL